MRRILFIAFTILSLKAQCSNYVYVPDSLFRVYINSIAPGAIVGDSMDITNTIITTIDSINITGLGITSIEGIEYFDSLKILEASYNNLSLVAPFPASMRNNSAARANLSHNLIDSLYGNGFLLDVYNLDLSYNLLRGQFQYFSDLWVSLNVSHNNLSYLVILPAGIEKLDCSYNQLTTATFDGTPSTLLYLDFSHNLVNSSNDPLVDAGVKYYDCSYNLMNVIPALSPSLQTLICANNPVNQEVELGYPNLTYLNIDSVPLNFINYLPPALNYLYCNNCSLYAIDSLPEHLISLDCRNNYLLCLPTLPDSLISLQAQQNYMDCLPNIPTVSGFTSDVGQNGTSYNVCSAGVCDRYVTVNGYAYLDLNGNGVMDTGEPGLPNEIITINPVTQTVMTDSNGYYSFSFYPGMLENIRPDSISYAVYKPDSVNIILNAPLADTSNVNFGFHYVDTFSDARVFATEVIRAIPGHSSAYKLTVNNHGGRMEKGQLIFVLSPLFTYISATPIPTFSGDTLIWAFDSLYPGSNLFYEIDMRVNNSDVIGTPFQEPAYVSIVNHDSFPANNLAFITDSIVGAYQRNNKTVSPQNYNSTDFYAGDYLDYTITFQNTDTATVNHVWIIDSLNPQFDISTLYIVAASAPYTLSLNGNALRVDFFNINLPDSAQSQVNSHGFFEFLIRPFNANMVGAIHNTAYIYFDGKLDSASCGFTICISNSELMISVNANPEIFPDCETPILGSATVTAADGITPYTYLWNNGATTAINNNLSYGQYYVTVTDQCITTAIGMPYVDSSHRAQIVAHAITSNQICDYDGSAFITACGGSPPYTYHWSNGQIGDTATDLYATNDYYCTVTDTAGNSTIVHASFSSIDYLGVAVYAFNCSYDGDVTLGSADADISNPNQRPFTYAWSNGTIETTTSVYNYIEHLQPGFYSVTVTDSLGCTATDTFSIYDVYSVPQVIEFEEMPFCPNSDSEIIIFDINNVAAVSFSFGQIYFYPPVGSNEITGTYTTNLGNDYLMMLISTTVNCGEIDTAIDNFLNPFSTSISILDQPVCLKDSNGIMQVNVNDDDNSWNFTVLWSNGNDQIEANNFAAGNYTVTVTDAFGCTATAGATLNASDSLAIAQSTVMDIKCDGDGNGAIFITVSNGSGNYTYNWSNLEYSASDTLLQPGNYAVTISDNTCQVSQTFTITQPDSLLISANIQYSGCGGADTGSIDLTVSGGTPGYSYKWSNDEYSFTDSLLTSGIYTCTVSDANNCSVLRSYAVYPSPTDSLAVSLVTIKNETCYGDSNGGIQLSVSGGIGSYTYNWNNGRQSATDTALFAGNYTCTITDSTGCLVKSTNTVIQPDSFYLKGAIEAIACYGETGGIIVTPYGGTPPYSFTWSSNNFGNPVTAGTYMLTVTDVNSCAVSDTLILTQPSQLMVIASTIQTLTCYGADNGSIDLSVSGGTVPYSYQWNNFFTGNDLNSLYAGTYSYTVTDSNGCRVSDSIIITQPDSFAIAVNSTNTSCFDSANGSISFTVTGGAGNYTYRWSNNATDSTNSLLPAGNYACTITDGSGCTITDSFTITQPDSLKALFTFQEPTCGAATGSITLDSAYGGTQPYTLHWNNGDTGTSISNISSGVYYLTITDNNGCVYTYSDSVPCITGIENITADDLLTVFPNPASTVLYINVSQKQDYKLMLRDVTGQMVLQSYFTESAILNVADLARGIYLAEIFDHNNVLLGVKKVVLQ